ncbi:MAG: 3-phosphoshikimate 1-carboxyvinyltransferase [Candidatus Marinimicrobia bacterium]|nr:3-phosphoshikimate 1-carboxyvinyltransferase [Candidatus Neomarinimicrobiota bacterium]
MAAIAVSTRAAGLRGDVTVPGDKSISHRALIMGALSVGETSITGLLTGEDVLHTARAIAAFGAKLEDSAGPDGKPVYTVHGRGIGGLSAPTDVLDMGNSGTCARLISGLLSAYPFTSFLTGDESLRRRPMERIIEPLSSTGAKFITAEGGRLPMTIVGTSIPIPLTYDNSIASAQVKSAVLLAGLHAPGITTVTEPRTSRDHTERMFRHFGVDVDIVQEKGEGEGAYKVSIVGQPELKGCPVCVPGDPSSAAFLVVAALIVPGSHLMIRNVGTNPIRTGLFTTLREMGADLAFVNSRSESGEPVADIEVKSSSLKGVSVPAARVPSMIDEYPILAIAASLADGVTRMEGLGELRFKESDRLTTMEKNLTACGISASVTEDVLTVRGKGAKRKGAVTIPVKFDHRIAMSFLVLGMVGGQSIAIDDSSIIRTSFPGFIPLMNALGASIKTDDGYVMS